MADVKPWPPHRAGSIIDGYRDFAIRADGTDQAAKLQRFQDALRDEGPGGRGILPAGRIVTAGTLLVDDSVHIEGHDDATELFLADNSNVDLIRSRGYGVAPAAGTGGGGPSKWKLSHLRLNGNAKTTNGQASTATKNTAGNGIKTFGRATQFRHLRIINFAELGINEQWSEGGYSPTNVYWTHNYLDAIEEARHIDVYVERCFGGGVLLGGPHDSVWMLLYTVHCGPDSGPSTTVGIETLPGSTSINFHLCHPWGNQLGYTWKLDGTSHHLSECQKDGPRALILGAGITWRGGVFGSSPDGVGLELGDASHGVGDFRMTGTKFTREGILLTRDSGNNTIDVEAYWPDASKQFFTGVANANKSSRYDVEMTGDADKAADGIDLAAAGGAVIGGTTRRRATRHYAQARAAAAGAHLPTGYKGQTAPRAVCRDSLTIGSGQLVSGTLIQSGPIDVVEFDPVSTLTLISAATAWANLDHAWAALLSYNAAGNQWDVLAKTADNPAALAANTHRDFAIAQTYTTLAGNLTTASPVVTGLPSTTGLSAGDPIQGTGVPAGTTILSVDSPTQITLSANANQNTFQNTLTVRHAATQWVPGAGGRKVWVGALLQGASAPAASLIGIASSAGLQPGANELEPVTTVGPAALTDPASLVTPLTSTTVSGKFIWAGVK